MKHITKKVSIIGMGNVGATAAYALILDGAATDIVLMSREREKAYGEKLDLEHGTPFLDSCTIVATDDYKDIEGSDVVVITAGVAQKPGETRLALVERNTKIMEEIIPQVVKHAPQSIILIVSNPVDVLTYKASLLSGLAPGRVFGSGTMLDTARFRVHLSEFLRVNPRSIHAYILGEHGDSSFPVISSSSIGGQLLTTHPNFSADQTQQAFATARQAAYDIIKAKGATYYAIGVVIMQLVKTILRDAKTVLPVSIPLQNYYGISDVALSIPCIIGKNGVEQTLLVELDSEEQQKLHQSATVLKTLL